MVYGERNISVPEFAVDKKTCTGCGSCALVCPAKIVVIENKIATIPADQLKNCIECQHCLAVCPSGSFSVMGRNPATSQLLADNFPLPAQLETLIKGRRSIRAFKDENLPPEIIQRLLDVSWHAPTGRNLQQILLTVVDDRAVMRRIRSETLSGLIGLKRLGRIPASMTYFSSLIGMWESSNSDAIFHGAPHMIITSAPKDGFTPLQDTVISLATFDLLAQSMDIGTLWWGLAKIAFSDLLPVTLARLGIPADHQIGYVILFGKPAVKYVRTVQRFPANVNRVNSWDPK